jgi:hypothetical protein
MVSLDTSPLIGQLSGPFSLAFMLSDGSATQDGNNAAVLSNFLFGTGGPSGLPTVYGNNVSGDLSTTVQMIDADPLDFFTQQFTSGMALTFRLLLTTNVDQGNIADLFWFGITDKSGAPIPTLGPLGEFLSIAIDGATPVVSAFRTDLSSTSIDIAAPQVQLGVPGVPEPGTSILAGLSLTLGGWMLRLIRTDA